MNEYIEREALVHHFMTTKRYLTKDLVMDAAYEIKKFPAADVAPVVHSHWVHDPITGIAYCAECQMDAVEDGTNYCPNCGARMDGGGDA